MGVIDGEGTRGQFHPEHLSRVRFGAGAGHACQLAEPRLQFFAGCRRGQCARPGKKPFHTLNPALARLTDGRTMVYGTMGGDGQPQTQAAVFTRYAVLGQTGAARGERAALAAGTHLGLGVERSSSNALRCRPDRRVARARPRPRGAWRLRGNPWAMPVRWCDIRRGPGGRLRSAWRWGGGRLLSATGGEPLAERRKWKTARTCGTVLQPGQRLGLIHGGICMFAIVYKSDGFPVPTRWRASRRIRWLPGRPRIRRRPSSPRRAGTPVPGGGHHRRHDRPDREGHGLPGRVADVRPLSRLIAQG